MKLKYITLLHVCIVKPFSSSSFGCSHSGSLQRNCSTYLIWHCKIWLSQKVKTNKPIGNTGESSWQLASELILSIFLQMTFNKYVIGRKPQFWKFAWIKLQQHSVGFPRRNVKHNSKNVFHLLCYSILYTLL